MIDGVRAMIEAEKAEPEPHPCKLFYFPFYGRAEGVRMLFHHANVAFEDVRIPQDQWPQYKAQMPGGTMPCVELPDGRRLGATVPMLRYFGRMYGYYPTDAT